MGSFLKILRISFKHHVTNEDVRDKINLPIRPQEDLITTVEKQTEVVRRRLTVISSGINHLARYSARSEKKVDRRMDEPRVRRLPKVESTSQRSRQWCTQRSLLVYGIKRRRS